jgi:adenylate cyclase
LSAVYENWANAGWRQDDPSVLFEKAKVALLQAIALDSALGGAYALLGNVYFELGDPDHGLAALEQAFVLNANDPQTLLRYGRWLSVDGRAREGLEMVNRAFRLNPHYPDWYNNFVDPFYVANQYDQVITMTRRKRGDVFAWNYVVLALSYAQLGRRADAAAAVNELSQRYPDFSLERALSDFGTIRHEATLALYLDGARKAGLHDCASEAELQKYPKMKHLAVCDTERATN